MATHLWLVCALGSALIWGFGYALSEKVMRDGVTPAFLGVAIGGVYAIGSLLLVLFSNQLRGNLQLLAADRTLLANLLVSSLAYGVGSWLIYVAISLKNATLASFIEVSYPVFTGIFAYLIFREVQVNAWTAFGSALIVAGIFIIFLKS
jgi:drug/metabolite transporter (DMT)-like permease